MKSKESCGTSSPYDGHRVPADVTTKGNVLGGCPIEGSAAVRRRLCLVAPRRRSRCDPRGRRARARSCSSTTMPASCSGSPSMRCWAGRSRNCCPRRCVRCTVPIAPATGPHQRCAPWAPASTCGPGAPTGRCSRSRSASARLRLGDDVFAVAAVRDITERVESEDRLHRVLQTLDATDDAMFMFDAATLRYSFVNAGRGAVGRLQRRPNCRR